MTPKTQRFSQEVAARELSDRHVMCLRDYNVVMTRIAENARRAAESTHEGEAWALYALHDAISADMRAADMLRTSMNTVSAAGLAMGINVEAMSCERAGLWVRRDESPDSVDRANAAWPAGKARARPSW